MRHLKSDAGVALEDAERILRQSHQRVLRVSVLDDLYNALPGATLTGEEGFVTSGAVSHDRDKIVRRSLSLAIANPGGVWTPTGPGSFFYWDKHLRVERGVRSGGVDYWAPQGVFLIDTPSVEGGLLQIRGLDRMDRATRSSFTSPVNYAAGSVVGGTIRDVLEDAGIGADRWTVNDGGAVLGAQRNYEVGDERLSSALTLATDFGLEVFADADAYATIQPIPDPASLPVAWRFEEGEDATHIGLSKSWSRDRFYNEILVTGESADTLVPIRATASDTNPSSPTRVNGPMGRRLYKHTSAMITTVPQAQAVANSLLWQHALIEEEIRVEFVPHPGLEAGDAIQIVDTDSGTDDVFIIDDLNMPLAGGAATLTVHKVRSLS